MTAIALSRPLERFVDIASSRAVRAAIELAVQLEAPVRVTGAPGTGKSAALQHHRAEFSAVYCECTGFDKDIGGLFRMLLATYGIRTDERTARGMADVLYMQLEWRDGDPTQRPLLVDEWQTLEPPAQRELLRLAETCRLPLVLCGNAERLFSSRTHKAALAQIESRIAAEFHTAPLTPEDCDSISLDFNVEGKEARALVRRLGVALEFRRLSDVLRQASTGVGSIQLRHLEIAAASLNLSLEAANGR